MGEGSCGWGVEGLDCVLVGVALEDSVNGEGGGAGGDFCAEVCAEVREGWGW